MTGISIHIKQESAVDDISVQLSILWGLIEPNLWDQESVCSGRSFCIICSRTQYNLHAPLILREMLSTDECRS